MKRGGISLVSHTATLDDEIVSSAALLSQQLTTILSPQTRCTVVCCPHQVWTQAIQICISCRAPSQATMPLTTLKRCASWLMMAAVRCSSVIRVLLPFSSLGLRWRAGSGDLQLEQLLCDRRPVQLLWKPRNCLASGVC